jgi:transcription elongation factor GreA
MNHSLEGARNQLVNQLVYLDEGLVNFLNEYFPGPRQQRIIIENTLNNYTSILEEMLRNFSVNNLNSYALIGSKVTVQYLDDNTTESFVIVFPSSTNPDKNLISFLSPIGLQLLMAQINETYELEIPSGTIPVRVQDIQYYNHGSVE